MNEYLEVRLKDTNERILIPLYCIHCLKEENDGVFVETGCTREGEPLGIYAANSYDEVKNELGKSEVLNEKRT